MHLSCRVHLTRRLLWLRKGLFSPLPGGASALTSMTQPVESAWWPSLCSHSPSLLPHYLPVLKVLCSILSPTQRGANSHLSPPLLDATVLQRITLPQHMDAVPGPCSRAVFSQFSVQGHSTRVHCRAPKHSLSLLQGWEVLIDFLQRHTAVLGSVKSKEYVTQNSL